MLDAGHAEKGSWGESRIARVSYADPMLVRLARRSYELYDQLAKESGEELMRHGQVGQWNAMVQSYDIRR